MAVNSRESESLALLILNRIFPETELVPDHLVPVAHTPSMTTTVVAHPVDTALAVMVTATEALLAVVIMMMIAVATVLPQELVVPLMTILLLVAASMILIVATTLLTHTPMVDLLMIVLHQETILPEILLMTMSVRVHVTDFTGYDTFFYGGQDWQISAQCMTFLIIMER